jgi:hypothetical protein
MPTSVQLRGVISFQFRRGKDSFISRRGEQGPMGLKRVLGWRALLCHCHRHNVIAVQHLLALAGAFNGRLLKALTGVSKGLSGNRVSSPRSGGVKYFGCVIEVLPVTVSRGLQARFSRPVGCVPNRTSQAGPHPRALPEQGALRSRAPRRGGRVLASCCLDSPGQLHRRGALPIRANIISTRTQFV